MCRSRVVVGGRASVGCVKSQKGLVRGLMVAMEAADKFDYTSNN